MLTRRAALLTTLAAGACATAPTGTPADIAQKGVISPSESVHTGIASLDGRLRLTTRICRYPALGQAWVWAHARTPNGFFSYVDHIAPCGSDATPEGTERAFYADTGKLLTFERLGPVSKPTAANVTGAVRARKTTTSAFGPGSYAMSFTVAFKPERLYSGLNVGRTEVFGRSTCKLTIGGSVYEFEGPAQFHEQRQSNPRFTAPFAYTTLWGENDAAMTFLVANSRNEGYLLEGSKATNGKVAKLDRPGAQRRQLVLRLDDGRTLEGETELIQAYTLPIFGNVWRGHMLRAELGGKRFHGHTNDYLTADLTYPGAAT